MPKVKVESQSALTPKESFQRLCDLLDSDEDLRRLDPGYSCLFDQNNLSGSVDSKQFTAKMNVTEKDSGSVVEIIVDLPFHLALIKGTISSTLKNKLDAALR